MLLLYTNMYGLSPYTSVTGVVVAIGVDVTFGVDATILVGVICMGVIIGVTVNTIAVAVAVAVGVSTGEDTLVDVNIDSGVDKGVLVATGVGAGLGPKIHPDIPSTRIIKSHNAVWAMIFPSIQKCSHDFNSLFTFIPHPKKLFSQLRGRRSSPPEKPWVLGRDAYF
jgi:hypothetical protein